MMAYAFDPAVINALKELAARVTAVEAATAPPATA
jgi:hypothetical protein